MMMMVMMLQTVVQLPLVVLVAQTVIQPSLVVLMLVVSAGFPVRQCILAPRVMPG